MNNYISDLINRLWDIAKRTDSTDDAKTIREAIANIGHSIPHPVTTGDLKVSGGETEHGVAEGVLEQINIHGDQKYFHIYADSAFKKLKCRFPTDLVDTATSAIGRKISASGILKYRANAFLPFEIIVDDIEIFSADSDLPDFDDLRGKAPNIMGGKASEEFISELRNDWH